MTAVGAGGGEEAERETSVCMAVRQRTVLSTYSSHLQQHACSPPPLGCPSSLLLPSPLANPSARPPCLPFMRTKANKQQNICMLSQHMRRSLSRKASLLSVRSSCLIRFILPLLPLVRLKYFALLSRNYKSGQLLKICSRITKFASERSNERIADCARFLRLARRLQPWAEARTRLAAVVPSGSGLLTN